MPAQMLPRVTRFVPDIGEWGQSEYKWATGTNQTIESETDEMLQ